MKKTIAFAAVFLLIYLFLVLRRPAPRTQGRGAAAGAAAGLWTDDFEAAKERAEREGKDILMDFTGSDWCGWCIRLRGEVFDQAEFQEEAPKDFVLVELDFPRQKELPPNIREQNNRLAQEFSIEGFPTIILADAKGRPYARTGYQEGGARAYLRHLADLKGGR